MRRNFFFKGIRVSKFVWKRQESGVEDCRISHDLIEWGSRLDGLDGPLQLLHLLPVEKLIMLLNTLDKWIDETPPVDQPSRFGNKAFRTWYSKLEKRSKFKKDVVRRIDQHIDRTLASLGQLSQSVSLTMYLNRPGQAQCSFSAGSLAEKVTSFSFPCSGSMVP
eukprot:g30806.t1